MILKLVAMDVETGNLIFKEIEDALPAGTRSGVFLNWNGSDWAETLKDTYTYIDNQYNASEYYVFEIAKGTVSGSGYIRLRAQNPYNANREAILLFSGGLERFKVKQDGTIRSNSLTANTYIGANANKEIVSIPSPNIIKYVPADITSTDGSALAFQQWTTALNIEANVTYELHLHLVFGNTSGRNGNVWLDAGAIPFTYRPIITGNINNAVDNVIIMRDTVNDKPDDLSNEAVYSFQTSGYGSSIIEMRGILRCTTPIANLNIKIRTGDDGSALVLKDYSYLKLSR